MNRTANTIKMLQLLSSGAKYKKKEIADYLEVNPRNINEYRKELEESGFEVESISGKDGGYRLKRTMISKLPMTSLSSDEWSALISASKYLETDTSFTKKNELVSAINKIKTEKGLPDGLNIIHSSPIKLNIDEELLKQIINDLEYAIEHKLFVKCHYISRSAKLDNQVKKGEYRPYALYIYQNMWYAIFERNNKPGKFFHVKLNRFKYLSITGKSFKEKYYESFKLDEYIEENGQVIDPLTFIIEINKKINPFFDEYKYGNQVVLTETDESISYQVTVQNKWQAKSIINHLGISCRVLSPTSLVDEIRTDLVNQLNKYKDVL